MSELSDRQIGLAMAEQMGRGAPTDAPRAGPPRQRQAETPAAAEPELSPVHIMLWQQICTVLGEPSVDAVNNSRWGNPVFAVLVTENDEPTLYGDGWNAAGVTEILAAVKSGRLTPPAASAPAANGVDAATLDALTARIEQVTADLVGDQARTLLALGQRVAMIEQTLKNFLQQRDIQAQQLELNIRATALDKALTALGAPHTPLGAEAVGLARTVMQEFVAILRE